ncbi:hypothetical protein C2S52_007248 [Perilla frutescens var. hirtella]|nr:hypothetical protein C2S52_007248 [Perilla frutescens var. hirtella]
MDGYVGNYLRFKVSLDITKPFMRGLTLKLDGNRLWIPLKFEAIPLYCFKCGILGHQMKNCMNAGKKVFEKMEDVPYGPWLKASPIKWIRQSKEFCHSPGSFFPKPLFQSNLPPKPNRRYTPSAPQLGADLSSPKDSLNTSHLPSLASTPFEPPNSLAPSSSKYILPPARGNSELNMTRSASLSELEVTADNNLMNNPNSQTLPQAHKWTRLNQPPRKPSLPQAQLTLAKRPSDRGVIDNKFEIMQLFKKLKDTNLVDVPCSVVDLAEIADMQSRREL